MLSISSRPPTKASSRGQGRLATSPPETTTSRTPGVASGSRSSRRAGRRGPCRTCACRSSGSGCRPGPSWCSGRSTAGRWAAPRRAPWSGSGGSGPRPPTSPPRAASPCWRRVRGPVGAPVAEDRDHVAADRVGVERLGEARARREPAVGTMVLSICGGTSIDMWPARPGRAPGRRRTPRRRPAPSHLAQLPDVLHAVRALPLRGLPLLRRSRPPSRGSAASPARRAPCAGRRTAGRSRLHPSCVISRPVTRTDTAAVYCHHTQETPVSSSHLQQEFS